MRPRPIADDRAKRAYARVGYSIDWMLADLARALRSVAARDTQPLTPGDTGTSARAQWSETE